MPRGLIKHLPSRPSNDLFAHPECMHAGSTNGKSTREVLRIDASRRYNTDSPDSGSGSDSSSPVASTQGAAVEDAHEIDSSASFAMSAGDQSEDEVSALPYAPPAPTENSALRPAENSEAGGGTEDRAGGNVATSAEGVSAEDAGNDHQLFYELDTVFMSNTDPDQPIKVRGLRRALCILLAWAAVMRRTLGKSVVLQPRCCARLLPSSAQLNCSFEQGLEPKS